MTIHDNSAAAAGAVTPAAITVYDFRGDRLDVVPLPDGDVGVCLRRVCEAIPVDPDSQAKRLRRAAKKGSRWACTVKMTVHDETGRQQEMIVLPRRSIPMFAATVSLSKVREDLRPGATEKLAHIQDECAEALADRFLGPRRPTAPGITAEEVAEIAATVARQVLAAASQGGVIGPAGASGISARIERIATMWVTAGVASTMAGAIGAIDQRLRGSPGVEWGGSGSGWEKLYRSREGAAHKVLEGLEQDARAWSRAAKVAQQASLFDARRPAPAAVPQPPAPPPRFYKTSYMARRLGRSETIVGRVLSELGLRERPELFTVVMAPKRNNVEGEEVPIQVWRPVVLRLLREYFEAEDRAKAAPH